MPTTIGIIGGGIVGLATGYRLLEAHPDWRVHILEKETAPAVHQTGHNSGVIHSGIYYRPGSLKARNCREGVRLLLDYCQARNIPYECCGKVIVATAEAERPRLQALYERGTANGVPDLRLIGPEELRELEPHAAGVAALVSPSTGIIDYSVVCRSLARDIQDRSGEIHVSTRLLSWLPDAEGIRLITTAGDWRVDVAVNCAGLQADRVLAAGPAERPLRIVPFRGEYYSLKPESRSLVNNLIYPVPDPAYPFLGVHFTRDLSGAVEAGPNAVLAFAREGYRRSDVDWSDLWDVLSYGGFWKLAGTYWLRGLKEQWRSLSKGAFVRSLQKLIPGITAADLAEGGAGVRAQALEPEGFLTDDFRIVREGRFLSVLNAPSPAATSSLAIGRTIAEEVDRLLH
ncbi:MAG: L-2-hydroxyglutarate oxidase [Candidatus Neomarinimicrobiota bacterium]|nr:MAG: L-2-hydroxyglutarate oxidase [Candidatus Neomarinimicrobiota bacterium]